MFLKLQRQSEICKKELFPAKNAAVKIPKDYLMDSVIVMEFVLCKRTMREFKNNPVSVFPNQGYL